MANLVAYYLGGGGKGTTRISGTSIEDIQKQASQGGINPANLYGEGFKAITPDVLQGSQWLQQMTGQATAAQSPSPATPPPSGKIPMYKGSEVSYANPNEDLNRWFSWGYSTTPPAVTPAPTPAASSWVDPATGQKTPTGIGMPQTTAPMGTQISNEAELRDKRAELIKLGIPENEWGDYITSPKPGDTRLYWNQPATLVSPTGEKKVVASGSTEANKSLNTGWNLGGQISDTIGVGLLTPQTDIITGGDATINPYLADTASASASATSKAIDEQIKKLQELLTPKETDLSKQVSSLLGELGTEAEGLTGRGAAQLAEEEKRGIEEKNQKLTTKNTELKTKIAEIKALTDSYNLANQQAEGVPMTLSRLQGAQAQNYKMFIAQKNLLTSQAGYIQAELLGMQGEIQSAQDAADRAVELEYQDRESAYNAKISQLNILQPQLEKEEKTYANAVQMYLQDQSDALAEQKQNKKDITSVKLDAISSGITDASVLSQIGNAKTYDEALQILGENMPEQMTATISEQLAAQEAGFDIVEGKIVSQQKTGQIVTDASGSSYDIGTYATDPNHENAVQSILNNMGQMTSYEQMDNYIQQVAPGSPITGKMVANASQKYGVSWESIMAIMQQDSSLGTAGAGARSFNPGNVGNTEQATSTGQLVNFGNWQSGVDAVAKNLAGRKIEGEISDMGIYDNNYEFSYNEKIDMSRLPDLGGKQITNKTARDASLPYGITDKQADWIQMRRPGSIEFQKLKPKDYDSLVGLFELKDDISEIKKLKDIVNTGWLTTKRKQTLRFFGTETENINNFSLLEQKTGKQLATYIKDISGAAVSEQEAQRLARNIPNVGMQDNQFTISLDDYEDDLDSIIQGKLQQYDFNDEDELRLAITGATSSAVDNYLDDDAAYQEYLKNQ